MIEQGKRVICIDNTIRNGFKGVDFQNWVELDKHYTIRDIFDNDGIAPESVTLEEIYNKPVYFPPIKCVREPAFLMSRFRELTEAELDALEEEAVNKKLKQNKLEVDKVKEDLEELTNV